jgi:maltooligosyltrehalose trehalohydrolase
MGEEYGEVAPFQFFISHLDAHLVDAVRRGRHEEFASFAWQGEPPDPQDMETFQRAILNHRLRAEGHHRTLFEFYQELIRLRKGLPALAQLSKEHMQVVGFEPEQVLCLRRWCEVQEVWLVLHVGRSPTSFQLPLAAGTWHKQLDSSDIRWGGPGSPLGSEVMSEGEVTLRMPPESCLLLARTTES